MRPLTWALKEVHPVGFVAHSHRLSTWSLCLESLRNRTPTNLKLNHISKNPWQEDKPHLANGALCLSTRKHNGKSGIECMIVTRNHINVLLTFNTNIMVLLMNFPMWWIEYIDGGYNTKYLNVFGEWCTSCSIKTSFIDLEKE
jgi:hypothetical protein